MSEQLPPRRRRAIDGPVFAGYTQLEAITDEDVRRARRAVREIVLKAAKRLAEEAGTERCIPADTSTIEEI
jgi:hypothetical protein